MADFQGLIERMSELAAATGRLSEGDGRLIAEMIDELIRDRIDDVLERRLAALAEKEPQR
jgi:hypothetical protein